MTELEVIKHYKTLCQCEQFVLTGSTALKHLGLIKTSSDIDLILVKPTPDTIGLLKRLQEEIPANVKPKPESEVKFIFKHDTFKIDVFIYANPIDSKVFVEGIQVNPISEIIAAKKRYNRIKDLVQLRYLSHLFFKESDLLERVDYNHYPTQSDLSESEY